MVYGTTLKLPGDFFESSKQASPDNETLLQDLRMQIRNLKQPHRQGNIFLHPALSSCSHVFVRCDHVTKPLTTRYFGPHKVIERGDKHFKIMISENTGEEFTTTSREHSNCSEEHGNNNNLIRTRYGRLIKPTKYCKQGYTKFLRSEIQGLRVSRSGRDPPHPPHAGLHIP
ncbi:putative gag-pol protein [Danaus plexippus plexippus]|uniref:Gag-pol protein n=1 Tax=Danaus plexippus plexippus TaxID=278856 RepID=A0A212EH78_DANPL|nr:putative gag-pol protein [Danaus plexippus plexippus]